MNGDQFAQIEDWRWRVAVLQQRTGESSLPQQQLGAEAESELCTALKKLQVAESELRQQNQELENTRTLAEAERQRYQELFEEAPLGYLVTDANATIREANRAACTLLNVPQKFLVGKPLYLFVAEKERRDFYCELTKRLRQVDRVQDWEVRLIPRNGAPFDAALTVSTVRDQDGLPVALRVCVRDITSRKRSELALRESERTLSTLMSKLPGMAYRCLNDSNYTFEFATVGCFELTGYHPSDFGANGKVTYALVIHPEDRSRVRDEVEAALCALRRFTVVYRIIAANGEEKWVLDRGLGIYATNGNLLAIEGFVTDITERKRAEELELLQQQTEQERLFAAITQRLRDSLDESQILQTAVQELALVLGLSGCNAALYNFDSCTSTIRYKYTTSSKECTTKTPLSPECIVPMAEFPEGYRQLLQGQSFQFCELGPNPIGCQVAILACPILDEQEVLGDLCLLTQQDKAFEQSEIRLVQQVANQCAIAIRQARLTRATQAQVEALAKLNQLKDDFLSTVSHELRTPVSNMKIAIRMLEVTLKRAGVSWEADAGRFTLPADCRSEPTKLNAEYNKVAHYLQILKDECEQEISRINDLLDLQRLEAGPQPKALEPIQLQTWLLQEVKPFEERIHSRGQSLQIDIAPSLPDLVCAPSSLRRILLELLNNACKYTPSGSQITVTACAYSAVMQVRVSNSGAEIPASELPHIFDKFYRIPSSDRWREGGTGLGLALAQKLTEHLGATLQVTSASGQTTFTIEFPICPGTARMSAALSANVESAPLD